MFNSSTGQNTEGLLLQKYQAANAISTFINPFSMVEKEQRDSVMQDQLLSS